MRHLNQIFDSLNLTIENGLFITGDDKWKNLFSNRVERLLKKVIQPDAFFCIDNKPFILFFEDLNDKKSKLKEIWNFNESPIVIITNGASLEIYNGFEYLTNKESLRLFGKREKLNDFSYFELVTGNTWEKYHKDFNYSNRIDYHLLNNIKSARELLISTSLSTGLANSILGKIIFVRYLIDRKVKLDFEQEGQSRIWTNEEFCQVLSDKNKVKSFFSYLKDKFNGDLFPITEDEIDAISNDSLEIIINLLSGHDVGSGQISLFDLYDFSIIPVEFISNVYELFIGQDQQEKQGAYYTPLFLVDYILSETVEQRFQLQKSSYNCKVLDPSCGSGIFLVETLRKIIERYQENNPDYSNSPEKYKKELKQLALDNIFGVDKDKSAINVAVFSIYLTLLDYQEPSDIESFKFPKLLNKNFFSDDFFNKEADFNTQFKNLNFDFILGNPPWKRGKGNETPLFEKYINERRKKEKGTNEIQIQISNSEIAQAFVLRVSDFSSSNTKISFIATSKILYNLKGEDFRKYLLDRFLVNKIFELAPVRREVFDKSNDKATTPAVILFYQYANGQHTDENLIEHITLKPSRFFSLFKVFTIQKNDYKKIPQIQLKNYDYLWKVLLYGTYLDFNLIKRLKSNYAKINDVVFHGKDYIVKQGMKRKDGDKKIDVHSLSDVDYIDLSKKQLSQFNIAPNLSKWNTDFVGYVYREKGVVADKMFSPPVLLIKETVQTNLESACVIANKKVVFTDKITAIKNRDNSDDDNYYNIAALLSSKLFSYYISQTGSATGVMIEQQIHDNEKFSFPYLSDPKFKQIIKKIEQTRSDKFFVLNEDSDSLKRELNAAVLDSFELSDLEKDTMNYTIDCVIPIMMRLRGYKKLYSSIQINDRVFSDYVQLFFDQFNNIYKRLDQKIIVEIKHTDQIVGLFFKLVPLKLAIDPIVYSHSENDDFIQLLTALGTEKITDKLFIQKDVRGFESNGFYIIKPNELRLWHKTIAHLDANEFMDAILIAGKKSSSNVW